MAGVPLVQRGGGNLGIKSDLIISVQIGVNKGIAWGGNYIS